MTLVLLLGLFYRRFVDPYQRDFCDIGWFGYNLGGEVILAQIVVLFLVPTGFWVWGARQTLRTLKYRTTVPIGSHPWFRKRLVEGRNAIVLATFHCVVLVFMGLLLACQATLTVKAAGTWLLQPPSQVRCCTNEDRCSELRK